MTRRNLLLGAGVLAAAAVVYFVFLTDSGTPSAKDQAGPAEALAQPPARLESSPNRSSQSGPDQLRVLVDDDPVGNLRLEGQVLADGDVPVGGAIVAINSNPPKIVTSEADGSFAIDGLLARSYELVARAKEGVAGPVSARLSDSSDPVILRLVPASSVEVTVVAAKDGKPVAGASVELRDIDTMTAATDAGGMARITGVVPGGYQVVATSTGFAPAHGWLRVPGGAATARIRLDLKRGAPVVGRVLDPSGKPVAGATVIYGGASDWSQQADPRRDSVQSARDGSFRFEALPAGSFRFEASKEGFARGRSDLVTLDGQAEKAGVDVRLEEGATLTGQVTSKAGQPVGGARVRAVVKSDGMIGGEARQGYADDTGRFEITGLPRQQLQVVALHETASSELVDVDFRTAPHSRDVTLPLEVDGAIAGVVVDKQGEPVEGAQVMAWPDFGDRRARRRDFRVRGLPQELTDAGGRFHLRGLEEGEYEVRAVPASAIGGMRSAWQRDPVKASTGQTDVEIVLPADGSIRGKVAFKDGSAPELFTVATGGFGGGQPFASEDGAFTIDNLAPRGYTVTVRGPGFDTKRVADIVVEEGQANDIGTITVAKGRTISGRVMSAEGRPVEGATVRAGKMLFGDGSNSKAAGGGPPWARNSKETQSDENGEFTLYGVGPGNLSIVAEHDEQGRSSAQLLRGTTEPITGVSLVLAGYGSMTGKVTAGGAPSGRVIVTAASLTVPSAMFSVASGEDGVFRFDRLAPDTYKVSAMTGGMMMRGMGFHSKTAEVKSGETTNVDLAIEAGEVTLTVTLAESAGKELNFSFVMAVEGTIAPKNATELMLAIGAIGQGYSAQGFSIRGGPVELAAMKPGIYTVCAVPYPIEVTGMGDTLEYGEREGDRLPAFCQEAQVPAQPAAQNMTLEVTAPKFVPLPQDS